MSADPHTEKVLLDIDERNVWADFRKKSMMLRMLRTLSMLRMLRMFNLEHTEHVAGP